MTPQEFKEKFIDEDGWVETGGECQLVETGESVIEHKSVYSTNVYMVGEEYFAVDFTRSNSGYWTDSYWEDPQIRKVKPIIVKTNKWVNVENS